MTGMQGCDPSTAQGCELAPSATCRHIRSIVAYACNQCSNQLVRRLLTMLLLAVFGLPFASPLFALGATGDAGLPACCRRAGRHHCAGGMGAERTAVEQHENFHAVPKQCPYAPKAVAAVHIDPCAVPQGGNMDASLTAYAAGIAQAECTWRIAQDRSRHKRGPPSLFLS